MNQKFFYTRGLLLSLSFFFPAIAYAQAGTSLGHMVAAIDELLGQAIPVVVTLGLLTFLWGLVKFMYKAGEETAKEEGRRLMVWGIIILFVMVSVWGLVALLNQLLGIPQGGDVILPLLPVIV